MARDSNESPIEIQHYLKGVHYPADNKMLKETAERNGAPEDVMEFFKKLPGKRYESPAEVMKEYSVAER